MKKTLMATSVALALGAWSPVGASDNGHGNGHGNGGGGNELVLGNALVMVQDADARQNFSSAGNGGDGGTGGGANAGGAGGDVNGHDQNDNEAENEIDDVSAALGVRSSVVIQDSDLSGDLRVRSNSHNFNLDATQDLEVDVKDNRVGNRAEAYDAGKGGEDAEIQAGDGARGGKAKQSDLEVQGGDGGNSRGGRARANGNGGTNSATANGGVANDNNADDNDDNNNNDTVARARGANGIGGDAEGGDSGHAGDGGGATNDNEAGDGGDGGHATNNDAGRGGNSVARGGTFSTGTLMMTDSVRNARGIFGVSQNSGNANYIGQNANAQVNMFGATMMPFSANGSGGGGGGLEVDNALAMVQDANARQRFSSTGSGGAGGDATGSGAGGAGGDVNGHDFNDNEAENEIEDVRAALGITSSVALQDVSLSNMTVRWNSHNLNITANQYIDVDVKDNRVGNRAQAWDAGKGGDYAEIEADDGGRGGRAKQYYVDVEADDGGNSRAGRASANGNGGDNTANANGGVANGIGDFNDNNDRNDTTARARGANGGGGEADGGDSGNAGHGGDADNGNYAGDGGDGGDAMGNSAGRGGHSIARAGSFTTGNLTMSSSVRDSAGIFSVSQNSGNANYIGQNVNAQVNLRIQ